MATLGSGTFDTLVPDLTDVADIQKALRLYHYGDVSLTTTPGSGIWGHLNTLTTNVAALKTSPIFLGTVTLPTGTASSAPLKFVAGTNLTSPLAGMMEFSGTTLSFSPSNGTRKTIAFTDSNITGTADYAKTVVYYGGSSGTMAYTAPNRKIYTGSTPPSSGLSVGDIWMW